MVRNSCGPSSQTRAPPSVNHFYMQLGSVHPSTLGCFPATFPPSRSIRSVADPSRSLRRHRLLGLILAVGSELIDSGHAARDVPSASDALQQSLTSRDRTNRHALRSTRTAPMPPPRMIRNSHWSYNSSDQDRRILIEICIDSHVFGFHLRTKCPIVCV